MRMSDAKNKQVTPEHLRTALKRGVATEIVLPGLPRRLVMVEYVVYDLDTAQALFERVGDGEWLGALPAIWVKQLEEEYRAHFGGEV
jgi:hypothetical protein